MNDPSDDDLFENDRTKVWKRLKHEVRTSLFRPYALFLVALFPLLNHLGRAVESVFGTLYDDKLIGGPEDDYLYGNAGTDILMGGAGNDVLLGTSTGMFQRDILTGGPGADTFVLGLTEKQDYVPNLNRTGNYYTEGEGEVEGYLEAGERIVAAPLNPKDFAYIRDYSIEEGDKLWTQDQQYKLYGLEPEVVKQSVGFMIPRGAIPRLSPMPQTMACLWTTTFLPFLKAAIL